MNTKVFAAVCVLSFAGQFIAGQSTNGQQDDPKCPEVWDPLVPNVFLPNRSNCSEYFNCVHGNPVKMACPQDLYWDQSMQYCNFPYLIDPPCPDALMGDGGNTLNHVESKAPCWGGSYERCAQNCESVVPDIGLAICKFACRQACPKN